MSLIRESDLPGIGRKFQLETRAGDNLVIVVHDDGRRELYHFTPEQPDDATLVATFEDEEARQIAGIIGGLAYRPKDLGSAEVALDDLVIEWYKLDPASSVVGKTIGDLQVRKRTGATIIAVIGATTRVNPGPDETLPAGATLVVAGERTQVKALKSLIEGKGE